MLSELENPSMPRDRRALRRFDMRLPASVQVDQTATRELLTETNNVSARGVFFYLDRPISEGTPLHVTLTFPPHITLTQPVRVRFTARVIRVEKASTARIGVAAMIEDYEFVRAGYARESAMGAR